MSDQISIVHEDDECKYAELMSEVLTMWDEPTGEDQEDPRKKQACVAPIATFDARLWTLTSRFHNH